LQIDELNLKLLQTLLHDGRKTFVEIAKENNTSKDVISKRFKQMKTKGIILGSTIQNSPTCFGANFMANLLIRVQRGKVKCTMQEVSKIPNVIHVYPSPVRQAVTTEVILKNIAELESVQKLIYNLPFVIEIETAIWMGKRNIPENLSIFEIKLPINKGLIENLENDKKPKKEIEIDEIDKALIDNLALNGRMSFEGIAKPLGVSTETIARRYEKLKQNGDLKVVVQIDPTKIGYYAFALFQLSFSKGVLAETIEKLSVTNDVNFMIKAAGYFDLTFTLMIRDINHFLEIQDQMVTLPHISHLEVYVSRMFSPWPLQREIISTF
jgi:Lrp/AsnC family transcriptional regulator, regulator for asnA, asnC and gidA